jgi:hypothetical protein
MDDEIYNDDNNPSIQAEKMLRDAGHLVETTDRMTDVLKSIKGRYYDIYILDVDMSFVKDEIDNKDNTGTTIGKLLRERNSFYNIIIFSAKGRAQDWFAAANYHFQGYVYKLGINEEEGVEKLVEHINKLSMVNVSPTLSMDQPCYENKALIYYHPDTPVEKISLDNIEDILNEVLPGVRVEVCTKLDEVKDRIDSNYAVALMFHKMFRDSTKTILDIKEILSFQPSPHFIIGVDSSAESGDEANRNNILNLVNAHPFKMLDLNQPAAESELKRMIIAALEWHSKYEIFEYPNELQEFIEYPLTEDDLKAMKGAEDYYDEIEDVDIKDCFDEEGGAES